MSGVRVAAASVRLTDDNMAELGSSIRVFDKPCEGEFRASALVIDAGQRIAIISVDSLIIPRRIIVSAVRRIVEATGIPEDHILICTTHTHFGPCSLDFLGFTPNEEFLRRIEEGCVVAATRANAGLEVERSQCELVYGKSQEATVGRNSRLLLKDGTIGWYGYQEEDVARPTGPYDPDLYVLAGRRPDGAYCGLAFNHSVHNISWPKEGHMSPGFYGLAAQELERRLDTTTLFTPGAIGSSHNVTYEGSGLSGIECARRLVDAVEDALNHAEPALPGSVAVLNRPFTYHLRHFDETKAAADMKFYMGKYVPEEAEYWIEVFRQMRVEMSPLQGEPRQTKLMAIRLGEIAFVGIPGEMFARLGLELRRRSPFRHTCVVGLANEEIGYIPDRKAYEDGGYQTWPGWHSRLEPGTGEAMVDQAVETLGELYDLDRPGRGA